MYLVTVVLLLFVLPAASVIADWTWHGGNVDIMLSVGKWSVFWAAGVRLLIAGIRQVLQPQFTAEEIFAIRDQATHWRCPEYWLSNLPWGSPSS